jgi:hypothetical protein
MPILVRRSVSAGTRLLIPALLLGLLSLTASQAVGQATAPETPLQKQLGRIDFAISAAGDINTSVSGVEQRDATTIHSVLTIKPSNTIGELVTVRYTAKPYVGFEFNFGNARNTQDYTFVPPPRANLLVGGAQAGVRELTLGYVVHPPYRPFGIQPYLGVGGGTIRFKPTTNGGQGLPQQYRAAYYYQLGLEDNFPGSHFGIRVGFRQLIYLAPDFLQNYLTITRRVRTSEPTIGFFVRF